MSVRLLASRAAGYTLLKAVAGMRLLAQLRLWAGYLVRDATLNRFCSLPFLVAGFAVVRRGVLHPTPWATPTTTWGQAPWPFPPNSFEDGALLPFYSRLRAVPGKLLGGVGDGRF